MQKIARAVVVGALLLEQDVASFVLSGPPRASRCGGAASTSTSSRSSTFALRPAPLAAPLPPALAGLSPVIRDRTLQTGTRMGIGGAGAARSFGKGMAAAAVGIVAFTSANVRRAAVLGAGVAAVGALVALAKKVLDTPSRPYSAEENSVGNEYDAWTEDGILESYWGEHIHLGYYTDEERKKGSIRKDFIQAKFDFVDQMAEWGGVVASEAGVPRKVLDVGCGVGGTSRHLAKKLGTETSVTGITLSPKQVQRATELAAEQGVPNAKFQVMDALKMTFEDDSFDVVWACESGEHMPDKRKYVEEMTRVLKPGGKLVIATWCQRDNEVQPFTPKEEKKLDFLYSEWTHPYFISINDYAKLMDGTGKLQQVETADWSEQTLPTWRLSVWQGVVNPWPWLRVPRSYYKTIRDAWCIERMHQAFKTGLMQYGMMKGVKKQAPAPPVADVASSTAEDGAGTEASAVEEVTPEADAPTGTQEGMLRDEPRVIP